VNISKFREEEEKHMNISTRKRRRSSKELGGAQRCSLGSSVECNVITFRDKKESDGDFHESKRRRSNHSSNHHMHT
jgi:hypothetical protein